MRVCAAGAHLGRHPDRFHEFLPCRAMPHSGFGVAADAVGALRDMATATAISCLVLVVSAPLAKTFRLNVWNASCGSGLSCLCALDKAPVDKG